MSSLSILFWTKQKRALSLPLPPIAFSFHQSHQLFHVAKSCRFSVFTLLTSPYTMHVTKRLLLLILRCFILIDFPTQCLLAGHLFFFTTKHWSSSALPTLTSIPHIRPAPSMCHLVPSFTSFYVLLIPRVSLHLVSALNSRFPYLLVNCLGLSDKALKNVFNPREKLLLL